MTTTFVLHGWWRTS
ncbi:trp operon leader peptide [Salmonella bongori]|uniref:trp operon leader peptide n=4 Tax=Salmonella TaxID=590 RepID=A0A750P1J2_SALER|nr:hypothetical protein [Salmonella bongori]ECG8257913.1 trp operon leader peptide [Salmonella bongori serovar 48:i:-]EGE4653695.1 trp operon leader peptide [Salmonella bongori serovar 40:z35:- str. 95-0123]EGE4660279.1 trp operon leader peptide [Salmonella bongori serovar 48:i:- str. 94-0708]EGS1128722.1 trp operon leader peptide [Salmonella bongori CFSAN000509]MBA2136155.1 trp operon leader peptide [Salmonella bongori serovar 66:z39:-]MBA2166374.1 trp operon leader peptide [Salmonella bongo